MFGKNRKKYEAFTLLEVLVVVALVAILSAVALTSSAGNKKRKAVEGAAREVAAAIREAQNMALTGRGAVVGTTSCTGVRIVFSANPTYSAALSSFNLTGAGPATCLNENFATYRLKNEVFAFAGSPATQTVTFGIPRGATVGGSVTLKKGSHCSTVSVNVKGNITEGAVTGC